MIRDRALVRGVKAACLVGAMALPGACAGLRDDPALPDWFRERAAETAREPFPKLAAVPEARAPSRPAAAWDQIEKDLTGAGDAVEASPRAAPAEMTPEQAAAFEAQARREAAAAAPRASQPAAPPAAGR